MCKSMFCDYKRALDMLDKGTIDQGNIRGITVQNYIHVSHYLHQVLFQIIIGLLVFAVLFRPVHPSLILGLLLL